MRCEMPKLTEESFRKLKEEIARWRAVGVCNRCINIVRSRTGLYITIPKLSWYLAYENRRKKDKEYKRRSKSLNWYVIVETWIEKDGIHCKRNRNGNCLEKILDISGGKRLYMPYMLNTGVNWKELYRRHKEGESLRLLAWETGYGVFHIYNKLKEVERKRLGIKFVKGEE